MEQIGTLLPPVKPREVVVNEEKWEGRLMPMTVHALLRKQKTKQQEQKMGEGTLLPTQFNKGR